MDGSIREPEVGADPMATGDASERVGLHEYVDAELATHMYMYVRNCTPIHIHVYRYGSMHMYLYKEIQL